MLIPSGDQALADAIVVGSYLKAASGPNGIFAIPLFPSASGPVRVSGERWDLGVNGSLDAMVPSAGNALRLASVPFRILTVIPAEGAEVNVSASFSLVTSGPIDPATITNVKLMKGTAEITLRRSLSLDGRTILLIPDRPLDPGTAYALVVAGLKGLNSETAPALTRVFRTSAMPAPVEETADFSRIRLSYPDESFNVSITIPEGAIPPRCGLSIEAPGMGSSYTGSMPASGAHAVQLRASLGERLTISVQFPSGKTMTGFLSRYEGPEGRVTIGVDGGRVDASDGSGASAIIPAGTFDLPVELKLTFSPDRPTDLSADYAAEKVLGVLSLKANPENAKWAYKPILTFPAPTVPLQAVAPRPEGLGGIAVYYQTEGFEADGQPARFWSLEDSASPDGAKLRSYGGLPGVDWEAWSSPAASIRVPAARANLAPGSGTQLLPLFGGLDESLGGSIFGTLTAMAIDSGPNWVSGGVYRCIEGSCDPNATPTSLPPSKGAFIFASPVGSSASTAQVAGQLVSRASDIGRYFLMSDLIGGLANGGARILALDRDFGVSVTRTTAPVSQNGVFGSYFQASPIVLNIRSADLGDRIAPYAEVRFEERQPDGSYRTAEAGSPQKDLFVVVGVRDNTTNSLALNLELKVDDTLHPACRTGCKSPLDTGRLVSYGPGANGLFEYRFKLDLLSEGLHRVSVKVQDDACNARDLVREFPVIGFGPDKAPLTGAAPTATVSAEGYPENVALKVILKVAFSEPVKGLSNDSVKLERLDGTAWVAETVRLYGKQDAVDASQLICDLAIQPIGSLAAGASYRIRLSEAVIDSESLKLDPSVLPFKTQNFVAYAPFTVGTKLGRVAALGNRIFVVRDVGSDREQLQQFTVNGDGTFVPGNRFAASGTDDSSNFYGQEVTEIRAFPGASTGLGGTLNLLLVTTAPPPGSFDRQSALWVFSVCNEGLPELLFGISLGIGSSGYTPQVDCRDGLIVAGRLSSSVLLIDIPRALGGWLSVTDPRDAVTLAGANQQAIVQPFYLTDPMAANLPIHLGVGLVPASGIEQIQVAVGYPTAGFAIGGRPLRGLPASILENPGGVFQIREPFKALLDNPGVDARTSVGPDIGGSAVSRVAVIRDFNWSGAPSGAGAIQLTLGIGTTSTNVGGNQLYLINDTNPKTPTLMGKWPLENPFGGSQYEILRRSPSIDLNTNLVGLTLSESLTKEIFTFILDIQSPNSPKEISRINSGGALIAFTESGIVFVSQTQLKFISIQNQFIGLQQLNRNLTLSNRAQPAAPEVDEHDTSEAKFIDPIKDYWKDDLFNTNNSEKIGILIDLFISDRVFLQEKIHRLWLAAVGDVRCIWPYQSIYIEAFGNGRDWSPIAKPSLSKAQIFLTLEVSNTGDISLNRRFAVNSSIARFIIKDNNTNETVSAIRLPERPGTVTLSHIVPFRAGDKMIFQLKYFSENGESDMFRSVLGKIHLEPTILNKFFPVYIPSTIDGKINLAYNLKSKKISIESYPSAPESDSVWDDFPSRGIYIFRRDGDVSLGITKLIEVRESNYGEIPPGRGVRKLEGPMVSIPYSEEK